MDSCIRLIRTQGDMLEAVTAEVTHSVLMDASCKNELSA